VTIRKLLWTVTIGLAATAVYLIVRESTCDRHDEAMVGYAGNEVSAVFHRLDCRVFHRDESSPIFVTRQQALDAGYRPCGVCCP
jgi:methylphosphotriester-DNA--protein-cysteine methyltransferase